MLRLFVAINLPQFIKDQLLEICELGMPGANWVDQDNYHLTLKFIGEVNESFAAQIEQELALVQQVPFALKLKGVGFFPPRKEPHSFWVGVEVGEELFKLQRKIERLLVKLGVAAESRKFSPHITLAKLKNLGQDEIAYLLSNYNLWKTENFQVEEFTLFRSQLTNNGPIYTPLADYPLVGLSSNDG